MSLEAILRNMEHGFSHSKAAFANAAEVANRILSRCDEMHVNAVETVLNWSNPTTIGGETYFSIYGLYNFDKLLTTGELDTLCATDAWAWERTYEEAIVTVSSLTKRSTSEQRELLATRGSFTAYLLLFMADKGIRLNRKSAWHQRRYNDILTGYFKTLSDSSLESQLHLFAGMFPAEKVNAWLDFLDESKDTTWIPGAIGTEAGGNNEDLYFNTPKRMIADILSDIGNIISELKFSEASIAESTSMYMKFIEAMDAIVKETQEAKQD
jgi:hypothetical protein